MAGLNFKHTTKSYAYIPKDNPKDRVRIVVGDDKDSTTFHPQVKLERFDNEINASIRLKHDFITGKVSYSDDGTKITWKKGQWKAVFYDKPEASSEGGFEFEIHIPKKPPINYLEFTVNSKQLDWFYQPALTQVEIDEGATRPENVVGSYAVYYKDCPANYVGGKEYKTGKAFHLFRPHITDASGKEIWGEWTLDETNGVLRLTCPQSFLDSAVYPVIVDPTFGNTTAGATATARTSTTKGRGINLAAFLHTAGTGETVTKLSAYMQCAGNEGDSGTVGSAIYDFQSGEPYNRVGTEKTITVTQNNTPGWFDSAATSESLTNGTVYTVAIGNWNKGTCTTALNAYFDTHATTAGTLCTAGALANPFNFDGTEVYKFSIYATYTAGGGTPAARTPRQGFINLSTMSVC